MNKELSEWLERIEENQRLHAIILNGDPENPSNPGLRSDVREVKADLKAMKESVDGWKKNFNQFSWKMLTLVGSAMAVGALGFLWIGFKQAVQTPPPAITAPHQVP